MCVLKKIRIQIQAQNKYNMCVLMKIRIPIPELLIQS